MRHSPCRLARPSPLACWTDSLSTDEGASRSRGSGWKVGGVHGWELKTHTSQEEWREGRVREFASRVRHFCAWLCFIIPTDQRVGPKSVTCMCMCNHITCIRIYIYICISIYKHVYTYHVSAGISSVQQHDPLTLGGSQTENHLASSGTKTPNSLLERQCVSAA